MSRRDHLGMKYGGDGPPLPVKIKWLLEKWNVEYAKARLLQGLVDLRDWRASTTLAAKLGRLASRKSKYDPGTPGTPRMATERDQTRYYQLTRTERKLAIVALTGMGAVILTWLVGAGLVLFW